MFLRRHWPVLLIWGFGSLTWLLYTYPCVKDDCWFYMVIARNLALTGHQTFSGIFPTNGAHPLWLYTLAGYSYLVALIDPSLLSELSYAVPLSAFLVLCGTWNLARIADKFELPSLVVAGLPLAFVLHWNMLYSEGHMLFFALVLLLRATFELPLDKPRGALLAGLLLGFVFLARLDSIFFVIAYATWYVWRVRQAKLILYVAVAASVVAVPYLIANYVFFGSAMPVSGWMKSSFPTVHIRGFGTWGFIASLFGYSIFWGIVPMVFSLLVLATIRSIPPALKQVAWVLLAGTVGQFFYIALFTLEATAWSWYYIIPMVLGAICAGIAWRNLILVVPQRMGSIAQARWAGNAVSTLVVALFVAATVVLRWGHGTEINPTVVRIIDFLQEHDIHHTGILVSDRPGYMAFASDNYVVAADMLTLNRPLYESMVASPDALKFLMNYCRDRHRPLEYVVYVGRTYMMPSDDFRSLVLNDPRQRPNLKPIGRIGFPAPPLRICIDGVNVPFVVWHLPGGIAEE